MVLKVVKYGEPVLRKKGATIETISRDIKKLIADMFETMYAYKGIGLAAQQVGAAVQLTVIDVRGVTDRPSSLELDGEVADVNELMPLVLINPQITPVGSPVTGPEGCLSFPEIYAEVTRPGIVDVKALDQNGKPIAFRCGGLLARAVNTRPIISTESFSSIEWRRKRRTKSDPNSKRFRPKPKRNVRRKSRATPGSFDQ